MVPRDPDRSKAAVVPHRQTVQNRDREKADTKSVSRRPSRFGSYGDPVVVA